jgi:hypothetical protein
MVQHARLDRDRETIENQQVGLTIGEDYRDTK